MFRAGLLVIHGLLRYSRTVSNTAKSYPDKGTRIAELEDALLTRDRLIETLGVQLAKLRRMIFVQ